MAAAKAAAAASLRSLGSRLKGSQVPTVRLFNSYKDEATGLWLLSSVILKKTKFQQFKAFVRKGWNSLSERSKDTIVGVLANGSLIAAAAGGASLLMKSLDKPEARVESLEELKASVDDLEARVNKSQDECDARYNKVQASLDILSEEVQAAVNMLSEKVGSSSAKGGESTER